MTQNNKPSTLPPPIDFARELVDVLTDRQAEDIVLLDMTRLQGFADYFIIATVDNIRLAGAVVDSLRARLKEAELAGRHEGNPEDGWLLVTCGQGIVVHLFSPERRRFYDLEGLWSEASEILRVQ
jgi:ribosome-associated protein